MKRRRMRGPRVAQDIADGLRDEFGSDAVAEVGMRVEEARQGGDPGDVVVWNEVARLLMARPEELRDSGGSGLWWLMQPLEFYRHQASEAEGRAAAATGAELKQAFTDLAMRWRELALQADLLAKRSETASRAGAPRRRGQSPERP